MTLRKVMDALIGGGRPCGVPERSRGRGGAAMSGGARLQVKDHLRIASGLRVGSFLQDPLRVEGSLEDHFEQCGPQWGRMVSRAAMNGGARAVAGKGFEDR